MNSENFVQPVLNAKRDSKLILVTGATGFVGKHLVKKLIDRGMTVRALGRNLKIGLELFRMGAEFCPVDLIDREAMVESFRGVYTAVHSGALSSAWGKYRDFYAINVMGTENVIEGCLKHQVKRLVYLSSPSVITQHKPQFDLDESAPYPKTFVSVYSETKALGEMRVNQARMRGLETVILRPKAIYGPGDQAIFPRLMEAASRGKLPILGDGETLTHITHIQDVVQAIMLSMDAKDISGRTYLITGGEEVNIWEVIRLIIARMDYPPLKRKIPVARALALAHLLEKVWSLFRLRGEPPLTCYKVSIMAYSQTYDITAARKELGYVPKIPWREGVECFLNALKETPKTTNKRHERVTPSWGPPVKLTVFQGGVASTWERIFGLSSHWKRIDVPALFALIEHPTYGYLLYDTGYSTRFYEVTAQFPKKLYRQLASVKITPEENASNQLRAYGIPPETLRWIMVSHFDPDHIAGLRDFQNARVICSWRAWRSVVGKNGFHALRSRLFPELLPDDLEARLLLLPDPAGPPFGPFDHSLDLFGDGSVRIIPLPGHAPGMLGIWITDEKWGEVFFCSDACWSRKLIETRNGRLGIHRLLAYDKQKQEATYQKLIQLQAEMPRVRIVPSHCPSAAMEFVEKTKSTSKKSYE